MTGMKHTETRSVLSRSSDGPTPHGVELRHLRYFVAVCEALNFTRAAAQLRIVWPAGVEHTVVGAAFDSFPLHIRTDL